MDPVDKAGYAYGYTESSPNITSPTSYSLKPGDTATWSRFLAVGTISGRCVEQSGGLSPNRRHLGRVIP